MINRGQLSVFDTVNWHLIIQHARVEKEAIRYEKTGKSYNPRFKQN